MPAGPTSAGPAPSRPSKWLLVLALPFVGYYILLLATDLSRPEPLGFVVGVRDAALQVTAVESDRPAARAGLQVGDRILAANSRSTRSHLDWKSAEMNLRVNQPFQLDVVGPDGARRLATIMPMRAPANYWLTTPGVTLLTARLVQLVTLVMALIVAFRRPFDPSARVGAWVLATFAVYSITWPYHLAAQWRALPPLIGALLWIPFASSLALAAVVFTFFATFPRSIIRTWWGWVVAWLPMAALLFVQLQFMGRVVYRPDLTDMFFDWTSISAAMMTAYTIAAVSILVIGYRRLTDVTERRRVRVLVVGSSVGLLSALPIVAGYWWRSSASMGNTVFASPAAAVGSLAGLALPLSFGYAILRHRLFDIRLMLRIGLRYALARRVVFALVPFIIAIFVVDLWISREMPVADILQTRGWAYAALASFAIVARLRRSQWLDALDRRFFRERLNAQRLLREVGEEVRNARGLEQVAARVVAQMEAALHAEFAALLHRHADEPVFEAVAVSPPQARSLSLSSASTSVELVRWLRKPVQLVDRERSAIFRHLPQSEIDWLAHSRVELLVPIQLADDVAEALFALGPKRSEEPYSAEDEDLLVAIADNVAWLLRRTPASQAVAREVFEECPTCGLCFDFGPGRCTGDGAALNVTSLPRVLGDRYRLDRRVGRGGMGAVYAAFDRALGRYVAVKVLREDLLIPDAAERFQSEARLAAALAHRNVVTVHDIGVTASGRAFFIMELLNGVTLRDELRRAGRLEPGRVLQILRDVGAGVDAAHRRQMVHRDLKPENVFLCRDEAAETAKVLDFGVAKALEASGGLLTVMTTHGMVAGTPQYMAPEHLSGGDPSPDWDLWALAVIAFEMITGTLPAAGAGRATNLEGLPTEGLRALFARALSSNPIERPTSVREFLDDLARELSTAQHELI